MAEVAVAVHRTVSAPVNRGGRPAKVASEKRKAQLQVLVTEDEYDTFCVDAIRARMTVSTYVRALILAARAAGVYIVAKPAGSSVA
jgi:hypothetical protein